MVPLADYFNHRPFVENNYAMDHMFCDFQVEFVTVFCYSLTTQTHCYTRVRATWRWSREKDTRSEEEAAR